MIAGEDDHRQARVAQQAGGPVQHRQRQAIVVKNVPRQQQQVGFSVLCCPDDLPESAEVIIVMAEANVQV
jgi:hypothetical protein